MKTILVDAVDAFIIKDQGVFVVFKEMYDLLETYPNNKIILTGADEEGFEKYGLDKAPYEVFTLKHNPEKTDPKYFVILLNKFDLKSSDVIYFEHNPKAVESARAAGIVTHYYDPDNKDLKNLKEFIDSNL